MRKKYKCRGKFSLMRVKGVNDGMRQIRNEVAMKKFSSTLEISTKEKFGGGKGFNEVDLRLLINPTKHN